MLSTIKEYLNDSYKFEQSNVVLLKIESVTEDDNSLGLIFDRTIFHPQGGGQPTDEGEIQASNTELSIKVIGLVYDRTRDVIIHKISKENSGELEAILQLGTIFNQKINKERRLLNARLHSAGHLLDTAVSKLGLNLVPGKGYHFQDGPYVEYIGSLDKSKINIIKDEMEKTMNDFINNISDENGSIVKIYPYLEGLEELKKLPDYLPKDKPFRWVKLTREDYGCPCGGTHVKNIKDIISVKISKITNKGKIVRISYLL